jgi:hypothetical protein
VSGEISIGQTLPVLGWVVAQAATEAGLALVEEQGVLPVLGDAQITERTCELDEPDDAASDPRSDSPSPDRGDPRRSNGCLTSGHTCVAEPTRDGLDDGQVKVELDLPQSATRLDRLFSPFVARLMSLTLFAGHRSMGVITSDP